MSLSLPQSEQLKGEAELAVGSIAAMGGLVTAISGATVEVMRYWQGEASVFRSPTWMMQLEQATLGRIYAVAAVTVIGFFLARHGAQRLDHAELIDMAHPNPLPPSESA